MPAVLPVPVIAVVGSRKSGKTTTVEAVVRGLVQRGYKVATAKHVHEPDFTFDARGKDTWRHAQAGARAIVGVAHEEMVVIRKAITSEYTLGDITRNFKDDVDVVVLEGFRGLVGQDLTVPKVVAIKTRKEAEEALRLLKPVLALSGVMSKNEVAALGVPYVDVKTDPEMLIGIIHKRIASIVQKRRELTEAVSIIINGKILPLNPYVQKVTRNVLFAVVSTLKGTAVKGDENVEVIITGN